MKHYMKRTTNLLGVAALLLSSALTGQAQDTIRRLGSDEAAKLATSKVQPEYPAIGKQLKLEGVVQVEASIDEKGVVENVRVVSGNVVLANSAVAAVKHWKFAPLAVDGKPAKGIAALNFTFKL